MKIAVVAPNSLPSRRANTIQTMKMTQAFASQGHTVRLAVPISAPHNRTASTWDELAHEYGLEGFSRAPGNPPGRFDIVEMIAKPSLRRYDYGWKTARWAHHWQADLVFTRVLQTAALASWLSLPTILEIHDMPQGTIGPRLFRAYMKGRGARRLVVITQALLEDLLQAHPIPAAAQHQGSFTLVAPDGVDLERYSSLPAAPQARQQLKPALPDRFTVGYTGHLYPGRGIDLILDLALQLPEVSFLLVGGEADAAAKLQAQIKAAGLDNVISIGHVANSTLPLYQAACDALIMPYQKRVEASSGGDIARYLSPMKVFEYMACGRTILSSDLPALREVLHPGNAYLVQAEDRQAWLAVIRRCQQEPAEARRLAECGRREAANYTWEARAGRILDGLAL